MANALGISGGLPTTVQNITTYAGQATVDQGLSPTLASAHPTGQTASIGSTNLIASAAVGMYKISYYVYCTATGTGNVTLNFAYNDGAAQTAAATNVSLAALTNHTFGTIVIHSAAAAISYSTAYVATGTYAVDISVQRLA